MLIQRKDYIKRLEAFRDQNLVKVVTGLRRTGKSTLFRLFIERLKATGVAEENIIQLNFDDPTHNFESAKELFDYIVARTDQSAEKTYVFLDEVQMVPEFQIAVNGLRQRDNYDVYITGSNAYLLSGELATLLSGRYIEIHMLPLSFREYLQGLYPEVRDFEVLKRKVNLREVLMDYLNFGGLPQTLEYYQNEEGLKVPNAVNIREYLENILSTIVYKDIMQRRGVADRGLLERIVRFILDNVGQPISTKKIVDTLNGNQIKASFYTVENYITALEECFLIYRVDRYDIRGRELLSTGYKYFVTDTGLRNYLLGRSAEQDIGQLLENAVFLELKRRRQAVQVGKYDNLEVDFVVGADEAEAAKYYQVTKDASEKETFEREVTSLKNIKDNYPKFLITLEPGVGGELDGIVQEGVIEWLVGVK